MGSQFAVQATGVLSAAISSAGASFALVKLTEGIVGLRVAAECETQGLDLSTHGETGYNVAFGGTQQ